MLYRQFTNTVDMIPKAWEQRKLISANRKDVWQNSALISVFYMIMSM